MKFALVAFSSVFLLIFIHESESAAIDATKELILTPLIKSGDLDKARAASEDTIGSKLKSSVAVKSYSGFFTVDDANNGNLFFWFFPAQENSEKAPLILHVNDSPGSTCLVAIALENGPLGITSNKELVYRNDTWTRSYNMLYIDSPVGSGFSFADSEDGYASSADDEANEIYEALQQFFKVFKEYQTVDFYMAGAIYAGTFMPHIAMKIDTENAKGSPKINLKGFIADGPFLDGAKQIPVYANYLYSLGLVDEQQKAEIVLVEKQFQDSVKTGDFLTALQIAQSLFGTHDSIPSKLTGFVELANALETKLPKGYEDFQNFLDTKEVHNYLHVGLHQFERLNFKAFSFFLKDFLTPHIDHLQTLLDKDYKILIMVSQFNIAVPPPGVMKVVGDLKWKGAEEFAKTSRKIWRVNGDVAGYVKQTGNFAYVLMRNAGSHSFHDQPAWSFDLVQRFIEGKGFD